MLIVIAEDVLENEIEVRALVGVRGRPSRWPLTVEGIRGGPREVTVGAG